MTNNNVIPINNAVSVNNAVPVSNVASVITTAKKDWQGLVAAGIILAIGGYALYKLVKW